MANKLKLFAESLLNDMGYKIFPNWRYEHYAQSEYLLKLFAYLEIDCVFDVGANDGQFGQFLRQEVGFDGTIISFEPLPASVEKLRKLSESDRRWIIKPFALGRSRGTAQFNVMSGSQFSSFLEPSHDSVKLFKQDNLVIEKIDVEIMTLADVVPQLCEELGISALYLKLDTQGSDLEVAYGAGNQLSRWFRALQSEASVKAIYKDMPNYSESMAAYKQMGFELSSIFPNNPGHFPVMIEFDLHMINRDYISPEWRAVQQGKSLSTST